MLCAAVTSRKWVRLEVTVNKYTVLRLECEDGRVWNCVEEVTHSTISSVYIMGLLHIEQSA